MCASLRYRTHDNCYTRTFLLHIIIIMLACYIELRFLHTFVCQLQRSEKIKRKLFFFKYAHFDRTICQLNFVFCINNRFLNRSHCAPTNAINSLLLNHNYALQIFLLVLTKRHKRNSFIYFYFFLIIVTPSATMAIRAHNIQ